jgi:hypothetical protein
MQYRATLSCVVWKVEDVPEDEAWLFVRNQGGPDLSLGAGGEVRTAPVGLAPSGGNLMQRITLLFRKGSFQKQARKETAANPKIQNGTFHISTNRLFNRIPRPTFHPNDVAAILPHFHFFPVVYFPSSHNFLVLIFVGTFPLFFNFFI